MLKSDYLSKFWLSQIIWHFLKMIFKLLFDNFNVVFWSLGNLGTNINKEKKAMLQINTTHLWVFIYQFPAAHIKISWHCYSHNNDSVSITARYNRSKPSLQIRTASAIFWIYLCIFKIEFRETSQYFNSFSSFIQLLFSFFQSVVWLRWNFVRFHKILQTDA